MAGVESSRTPSRDSRLLGAVALTALLAALGTGALSPALSQTLNDQVSQRSGEQKSRLLVDAREIVYDREKNRVEARGDVQLYYQGRTLQADRVTYDRMTKRVYAEGNSKLTEANGNTIYSDRFELTDDFRDGFIDSLRVVSPDNQRITAARGERTDGETTVFERGTYTACNACKDDPERPPLWQVKAARIIAKNSEQMIYYEDARIEFFGLPLAYIPFFSAPDPTVTRKSGILTPRYSRSSATGYRVSLPIYWAPAPHYDVLWTPSYLSKQGMLNEVEWRHRLETGVYNIRAAGIFQNSPSEFLPGPLGPNYATTVFDPARSPYPFLTITKGDERVFRGSIETTGQFLINKNWKFGWDATLQTDKYFLSNYRIKADSLQAGFFKESVSSVYLRGKTERAYFDMSASYIQGLTQYDWQKQLPATHPVIDYNRRFQLGGPIGGELALDINVTSLTREVADYSALPPSGGGPRFGSSARNPSPYFSGPSLFIYHLGKESFGVYSGCVQYQRGDCLLRGAAGSMNRVSTTLSWRRAFIDPVGQVWTPFVNAQVDLIGNRLDITRLASGQAPAVNPANSLFGNDKQTNFVSADQDAVKVMPSVGLDYRYPLVGSTSWGTQLFEPMAQIIASPNETRIGRLVNEDSQNFVFSDSNLFSLNRFSGYDRTEGGVRANVGAQYTLTMNNGSYLNALIGQSYHLAGRNSFAANGFSTDVVNAGLNSGLEKSRSDYVGRFAFSPSKQFSLIARGRFDEESLKLQRLEIAGQAKFGMISTSIVYAKQEAQPDLGYVRRREGIAISNSLALPNNWSMNANVVFDLDRYITDRDLLLTTSDLSTPEGIMRNLTLQRQYNSTPFRVSAYGLGVRYADECTIFSVQYTRSVSDTVGTVKTTSSTVLFKLELKNLGELSYRAGTASSVSPDGTR